MTWEQRWHPLREEWVIIAAHRNDRPWDGTTLGSDEAETEPYRPDCPLCPGNLRSSLDLRLSALLSVSCSEAR